MFLYSPAESLFAFSRRVLFKCPAAWHGFLISQPIFKTYLQRYLFLIILSVAAALVDSSASALFFSDILI